jgi:hypothetical protein
MQAASVHLTAAVDNVYAVKTQQHQQKIMLCGFEGYLMYPCVHVVVTVSVCMPPQAGSSAQQRLMQSLPKRREPPVELLSAALVGLSAVGNWVACVINHGVFG